MSLFQPPLGRPTPGDPLDRCKGAPRTTRPTEVEEPLS